MFKAVRISILLFILFFVAVSTWLTQARSTDWNNSLWVKIYPINADGSAESTRYIADLEVDDFAGIEAFITRETERYARGVSRPVRIELGRPVLEQPPAIPDDPNMLSVMMWSLLDFAPASRHAWSRSHFADAASTPPVWLCCVETALRNASSACAAGFTSLSNHDPANPSSALRGPPAAAPSPSCVDDSSAFPSVSVSSCSCSCAARIVAPWASSPSS